MVGCQLDCGLRSCLSYTVALIRAASSSCQVSRQQEYTNTTRQGLSTTFPLISSHQKFSRKNEHALGVTLHTGRTAALSDADGMPEARPGRLQTGQGPTLKTHLLKISKKMPHSITSSWQPVQEAHKTMDSFPRVGQFVSGFICIWIQFKELVTRLGEYSPYITPIIPVVSILFSIMPI